jgi:phosphoribosylglycinamide formyltransferase-1
VKNIAIFASGSGSNAEKIMEHFSGHKTVKVKLLISNNPDAGVLKKAKKYAIPAFIIQKKELNAAGRVVNFLNKNNIDLVVLAGFLLLVPKEIVNAFPKKIVNIHPALLPKYGGKGMHGMHVHEAVQKAAEKETGISIHYVNEHYDEGNIIFQATCPVFKEDTAEKIASKVLALEHANYAAIIEKLLV